MQRFRVALTGIGGLPGLATHYFGGAIGSVDTTNARARVVAAWTAWEDAMSSGVTWTLNTEVADVEASTGNTLSVVSVAAASGTGNLTGEILPTLVQGLVKWNTGAFFAGRRLIGHTFLPGPAEVDNPAGVSPTPGGTYPASAAAGIAAMLAAPSPGLIVWRRPVKDPVTGVITRVGTSSPVSSGVLVPRWSVLRSRRS